MSMSLGGAKKFPWLRMENCRPEERHLEKGSIGGAITELTLLSCYPALGRLQWWRQPVSPLLVMDDVVSLAQGIPFALWVFRNSKGVD